MKKILLLLVLGALFSCDIGGDDDINFELELMPITDVNIPLELVFNESNEITVNYFRPNGCYEFNDFIVQPDGNTRTVAAVDAVYNDPDCSQNSVQASVSFNFRPLTMDPYVFQFYQGASQTGEAQYLIIEVPVVE